MSTGGTLLPHPQSASEILSPRGNLDLITGLYMSNLLGSLTDPILTSTVKLPTGYPIF